MKEETIKFIERVTNYQVVRNIGDDELTIVKKYYRNRLNACYNYLKVLSQKKNGSSSLDEDYKAVLKLTKTCEKEYLNWKENYEKNH